MSFDTRLLCQITKQRHRHAGKFFLRHCTSKLALVFIHLQHQVLCTYTYPYNMYLHVYIRRHACVCMYIDMYIDYVYMYVCVHSHHSARRHGYTHRTPVQTLAQIPAGSMSRSKSRPWTVNCGDLDRTQPLRVQKYLESRWPVILGYVQSILGCFGVGWPVVLSCFGFLVRLLCGLWILMLYPL